MQSFHGADVGDAQAVLNHGLWVAPGSTVSLMSPTSVTPVTVQ